MGADTLAARAGLDLRTALRKLSMLEELGLLVRRDDGYALASPTPRATVEAPAVDPAAGAVDLAVPNGGPADRGGPGDRDPTGRAGLDPGDGLDDGTGLGTQGGPGGPGWPGTP